VAALLLDPYSLRSELASGSMHFQDWKDTIDSPIDPQFPAVEQTDLNNPLVQLFESVELAQIKRGCSASDIWTFFTGAADQDTRKSSKCRHCDQVMNHQKRRERVATP
jgi:hypothetical protein